MLGTGKLADELDIEAEGDQAPGIINFGHYSSAHKSAMNAHFVADCHAAFPNGNSPNFLSAAGYDAMAVIYAAPEKTSGKTEANGFVAAF